MSYLILIPKRFNLAGEKLVISENLDPEMYNNLVKQYFQSEYQDFVSFLINDLDVDYKSRILHVGSEVGWLTLELARRMPDTTIFGIEEDLSLCEFAHKNKIDAKVENVEFINCSLHEMQTNIDNPFNVVFAHNVFHTWENPEQKLNAIRSVLKKNGKYAIYNYRKDLRLLAKISAGYKALTMPPEFRKNWKSTFSASYSLDEVIRILLKTRLKDWKIRSTMFDFLIYKI